MIRNVLVFGATGKTGNLICSELESKNISYSVFLRENSEHKFKLASTKIKRGDVLDKLDVENAFKNENFTDVIIALGSKQLRNSDIRSRGTHNIIEALKKNQSKPCIHLISALGVGNSWSQLKWHAKLLSNLFLKSVMNDHTKQEELVQNNTFPYHILRPVGLKNGPSKGKVIVQNEGFIPGNYIQRIDVAKFLVESLIDNKTGVSGICQ